MVANTYRRTSLAKQRERESEREREREREREKERETYMDLGVGSVCHPTTSEPDPRNRIALASPQDGQMSIFLTQKCDFNATNPQTYYRILCLWTNLKTMSLTCNLIYGFINRFQTYFSSGRLRLSNDPNPARIE
jgi:hypothetical protein